MLGIILQFDFVAFYEDNLRVAFFSGFLTLTGFLFSLHTFLLVTLYRDIYSKKEYRDKLKKLEGEYNKKIDPNKPLKNISLVLNVAIWLSFLTSMLQITLGLSGYYLAAGVCVGFAGISAIAFAVVLLIFRSAILDWFNQIDKESQSN